MPVLNDLLSFNIKVVLDYWNLLESIGIYWNLLESIGRMYVGIVDIS